MSQPDYGEQALEIADKLVATGAIDLIVIDSVAALVPEGGDRGGDGRRAHGPAGAPHEPGAAQADRRHRPEQHGGHLHQPAAPEDRRRLRQPRDHDRRQRAEVLRVGAARHPQDRRRQERRADRRHAGAREGREEQGRAAVPRGGVRDPLRRRRQRAGRDRRPRRRRPACSRSRARSTRSTASASPRGATRPAPTSPSTRRSPRRCASLLLEARKAENAALGAPVPPPSQVAQAA